MRLTVKKNSDIGRRERKKLELRKALIEAAYELFESKGFDETRIEDITDKVDVSSRTFFRYFSSKEDVVLDYQAVEHDEIVEALTARPAAEPALTALRHATVEVTRGCEEGFYGVDGDRFKTLRTLIRSHPLICARSLEQAQQSKNALAAAVAERMNVDPRLDGRPMAVANVLEFASSVAYELWKEKKGIPYSDVLDEVFEMIENGLNYR